jgi:hypothetical protein
VRVVGLDRGKKVYYILYKLIEMIRMFSRCKEFMKIGKIWQGDNWGLVDLKIGGG